MNKNCRNLQQNIIRNDHEFCLANVWLFICACLLVFFIIFIVYYHPLKSVLVSSYSNFITPFRMFYLSFAAQFEGKLFLSITFEVSFTSRIYSNKRVTHLYFSLFRTVSKDTKPVKSL